MEILFITLPLALILALIFIGVFIYSVKSGQYEDLETPSYKLLLDDEKKLTSKEQDYE